MNYGYIYIVTDLRNGRKYIGQKKGNFDIKYFGSGLLITRVIKKYGTSNLELKVIDYAFDENELNELEKLWIKKYNSTFPNGYNITEGGHWGDTFHNHPNKEEIRKNRSESHKGKTLSDETKQKLRIANTGRIITWGDKISKAKINPSQETRDKLSRLHKGRIHSEEHRLKNSLAHIGKYQPKKTIEQKNMHSEIMRNIWKRRKESINEA